jgi:hypothetical protein
MPLLLAGVCYSLGIIVDSYRGKRTIGKVLIDWDVIISLPTLFVFFFLMGQVIFGFCYDSLRGFLVVPITE